MPLPSDPQLTSNATNVLKSRLLTRVSSPRLELKKPEGEPAGAVWDPGGGEVIWVAIGAMCRHRPWHAGQRENGVAMEVG